MADASAVLTPAQVLEPFYARPAFLFARIDQICTALYADLAVDGETLTQAEFLLVLQASPGLDQITLSRATGVDKSTVALVVDTLEQRGLIIRKPDPADGRRLRLQLGRRGRAVVPRVAIAYQALQLKLTAPFSRSELALLRELLLPLAANPMSLAPPWQEQSGTGMTEEGQDSTLRSVLTTSLSFLCRRGLQVTQAQFVDSTAALALTPRQFSVLYVLSRVPELSQIGFSRLYGLDPANAAVIMKNLVNRGLLDRVVPPWDRRQRVYSLNERGAQVMQDALPLVEKSHHIVFRHVPPAKLSRFVKLLRRLTDAHQGCLRFPGCEQP